MIDNTFFNYIRYNLLELRLRIRLGELREYNRNIHLQSCDLGAPWLWRRIILTQSSESTWIFNSNIYNSNPHLSTFLSFNSHHNIYKPPPSHHLYTTPSYFPFTLSSPLDQRQNTRQHSRITSSTRRLHTINITSPPWSTTPPDTTQPNIRILPHISQHIRHSRYTLAICTPSKLPNNTFLASWFEPRGGSLETGGADCGGDTSSGGTGSIRIEVLVHFVDDFVLRVGERC